MDYEDLDDNIKDLIIALNDSKTPIKTKYSCEGHTDEEKFYIMFADEVNEQLLLEWFKNFTKYDITYNGKLKLKSWVRWTDYTDNPVFKANWMLEYNAPIPFKKRLFHELLWYTKDFMKQKSY